ncbi:cytochrome c3 family protein [Desulfocapsa sp. AH-315-G09]|nr:cytochrome c3 family protein [Desulfocapsa sp.]MBN4048861.1 cytochrome c3 family protein [bacterium AH-315-N22]MBN4065131.1 cytochrome c3 family protein [Desulfocapsa sp. AH-315-G09]
MRIRKKIMLTALTLTVGTTMFLPVTTWSMTADDAPETVTIDVMSNLYGPVEFNHEMHVEYASCQECHHHTTGEIIADPNCARCHHSHDENDVVSCSECHVADRFNEEYIKTLEDPKLFHIDKPGLKGAYHLNCIGCHDITSGPVGCVECHTMTEAGEKMFNTGAFAPAKGTSSSGH